LNIYFKTENEPVNLSMTRINKFTGLYFDLNQGSKKE